MLGKYWFHSSTAASLVRSKEQQEEMMPEEEASRNHLRSFTEVQVITRFFHFKYPRLVMLFTFYKKHYLFVYIRIIQDTPHVLIY